MAGNTSLAGYVNLISFVPAKGEISAQEESGKRKKNAAQISGEEAKSFYENLLNTTNNSSRMCSHTKKNDKRKKLINVSLDTQIEKQSTAKSKSRIRLSDNTQSHLVRKEPTEWSRKQNKLLLLSQTGDLSALKKLLKSVDDININHQDSFGWTALMCATAAGHTHVVDFLLENGADKTLCNNQDQTASQIASTFGLQSLMLQIEMSGSVSEKEDDDGEKLDSFFCEKCKATFKETSVKEHTTSTVHLFNRKLKPKIDPFMIPKTNIGYKLMKQSGWDEEKGLGPQGQGQRLPVKTVLKKDRSCIGLKSSKTLKKITHFGPYDAAATASSSLNSKRIMGAAAASRRERRKREAREKDWERNLRQSMDF